jgi:hypothetical protein
MGCRELLFAWLIWCLVPMIASAQPSAEKILPLDGHFNADGTALELNWFEAQPPRAGSVTVKRRLYGQSGGKTWQTIAKGLGPVMRYTDTTVRPGVAYEYQVLRTARDIVDVGYWLAGTELPARARRGNAYMIVDETITAAIAPRLSRFEQDLIGDGWQVQRHDVPRDDSRKPIENLKEALAVKEWLQARYTKDPFGQHAVILIGHVPIVKSGKVNPDGHEKVPHATDLFYADIDGRWTATRTGEMLNNRVPGDFIELQIGRIDFAPVSEGNRKAEIHLLRAYFDKNHHWRMGYIGDLREAYGNSGHLAVEQASLRNIVGFGQVMSGGHHDVGEEKPWLWGVDFGDWNGTNYAEKYANKAVFTINFGSAKQKINRRFNGMTTLLAQPWYPVAVGWGGRPAWWLHHMALGGSIGDVHMRTVNNGYADKPYRETMDYFPTGNYLMRNGIWVNLLGDPTLSAFPLSPVRDLTAQPVAEGVTLSWRASPDPDTLGYRIFRAPPDSDAFTTLSGSDPVRELTFIDIAPLDDARYMVRAYGLKKVYSGSFYRLSQGSFSANHSMSETKKTVDMEISTPIGQAIPLPEAFHQVMDGKIYALIEGPARGQVTLGDSGWLYMPPAGFAGTVDLRFSVSTTLHSQEGVLTITVGG